MIFFIHVSQRTASKVSKINGPYTMYKTFMKVSDSTAIWLISQLLLHVNISTIKNYKPIITWYSMSLLNSWQCWYLRFTHSGAGRDYRQQRGSVLTVHTGLHFLYQLRTNYCMHTQLQDYTYSFVHVLPNCIILIFQSQHFFIM